MTKRFGLVWFLPVDLLLRQKFESRQKITSVQMPILIIHGTDDPQIPVEMGRSLYAAAPRPKQLLIVPGLGHDNNMPKAAYPVVGKFIHQSTRSGS